MMNVGTPNKSGQKLPVRAERTASVIMNPQGIDRSATISGDSANRLSIIALGFTAKSVPRHRRAIAAQPRMFRRSIIASRE